MGAAPPLIAFDAAEAMAARLAQLIALQLRAAIAEKGAGVLLVSGGSTPQRLYAALANADLDWARVTIGLVDERWVAPDAAGSNERFVRGALLKGRAGAASFVGMKTDAASPVEAVGAVAARYEDLGPPDAVVLGMGNDGHAASWFPRADGLDAAIDPAATAPVAAVRAVESDVTGPYLDRITVTLGCCLQAPLKILLMQGAAKRETYEKAAEDLSGHGVYDMPVRALLSSADDLWAAWAP